MQLQSAPKVLLLLGISKEASLAAQEIKIDFAVLPVANCQ